jgi:hypothetical protein
MSKCIVSFSSFGRENYPKGQLRLIRSIKESGWNGGIIIQSFDGYVDEYLGVKIELGEYPSSKLLNRKENHASVPYFFKPELIQIARERGYNQVIWCDSTILVHKDPSDCLEHASIHGVAAFENIGHPLKHYCSDLCVIHQGITEKDLEQIPQIMACCVVFDFENKNGQDVFKRWLEASTDGVSFQNYGSKRDGFITHKHDQAVLSILLWKAGIPLLPYGKLVYHPHNETGEYGFNYEFINKGL